MPEPDPAAIPPAALIDALFERILERLEAGIQLASASDRPAQLGLLANTCRELAELASCAVMIGREQNWPRPSRVGLDF